MRTTFASSLLLAGTLLTSGIALSLATPPPAFAQTLNSQQRQQIEAAVIRAIGNPNAPTPQVSKIVLQGQYGLASWQMGEGGGLPGLGDIAQRTGIPISVARQLLAQYSGETTQASSTAVPLQISMVEEQMAISVSPINWG